MLNRKQRDVRLLDRLASSCGQAIAAAVVPTVLGSILCVQAYAQAIPSSLVAQRPSGDKPASPPVQAPEGEQPKADDEKDAAKVPPEPPRLTEGQTKVRIQQFGAAEHWALQGLVLLSLGPDWHPSASAILEEALTSRDATLRIYALEALARSTPATIRRAMTPGIVNDLIRNGLRKRKGHELIAERAHAVLQMAFPTVDAKTGKEWKEHWFALDRAYAREPWIAPPVPLDGKSVASAAVDRAFDLYEAGLDVVICIDSTGSMQRTIDAAASATDDLVAVLSSVAPKFRLGLVHYRDMDDMKGGARVLEKLQKRHEGVREKLSKLRAEGGGDIPERVEKGLELALDPRAMGWKRSTNKLVIVIGDAPPHPNSISTAIELAAGAYQTPFGKKATTVRGRERDGKSTTKPTRAFITACIGVGRRRVANSTRSSFQRISNAGGGSYGEIVVGKDDAATDELIAHVLRLSFGAQHKEAIDAFVNVFLQYHRKGLLD